MAGSLPTSASIWPYRSIFMWLDIRACQDSNGDGIGDLPGLIARLGHFERAGVGALPGPALC